MAKEWSLKTHNEARVLYTSVHLDKYNLQWEDKGVQCGRVITVVDV